MQVNKFISIPEHYAVYCKERGLIQASDKPEVEAADDDEEEGEDEDMEGEDEDMEGDSDNEELQSNSEHEEGDLWRPHQLKEHFSHMSIHSDPCTTIFLHH